jgi:hypothetical protein
VRETAVLGGRPRGVEREQLAQGLASLGQLPALGPELHHQPEDAPQARRVAVRAHQLLGAQRLLERALEVAGLHPRPA